MNRGQYHWDSISRIKTVVRKAIAVVRKAITVVRRGVIVVRRGVIVVHRAILVADGIAVQAFWQGHCSRRESRGRAFCIATIMQSDHEAESKPSHAVSNAHILGVQLGA